MQVDQVVVLVSATIAALLALIATVRSEARHTRHSNASVRLAPQLAPHSLTQQRAHDAPTPPSTPSDDLAASPQSEAAAVADATARKPTARTALPYAHSVSIPASSVRSAFSDAVEIGARQRAREQWQLARRLIRREREALTQLGAARSERSSALARARWARVSREARSALRWLSVVPVNRVESEPSDSSLAAWTASLYSIERAMRQVEESTRSTRLVRSYSRPLSRADSGSQAASITSQ